MTGISSPDDLRNAYASTRTAQEYHDHRFRSPLGEILHHKQVELLRELIRQVRPTSILEIACGPARLTAALDPYGAFAVAVDASEGMLAEASNRLRCAELYGAWHLVRADAFALPLDRKFDLIYTFRFIRHFRQPDRQRIYAALVGHLAPNGLVAFDAVNRQAVGPPSLKRGSGDLLVFDEYYDRRRLICELAEAGLQVSRLVPVHPVFRLQTQVQNLIGPHMPGVARRIVRGLERCGGSVPAEWIVVCRSK